MKWLAGRRIGPSCVRRFKLAKREWLPACRGYVERATARPAFVKADADQMAHFAAAD